MTPSKSSQSISSFESIRKQAKKLVRLVAANDPVALARVRAQLPSADLTLSLRDSQFVLAREYGFAGWQELRGAALRQEGKGLEWAASQAEQAVHDSKLDRLKELVRDYPALLTWQSDTGESLLGAATGSFGDSGDSFREQTYTRVECAEFLLDAGAVADPAIWEGAIRSRAKGILQLLSHKGVLPRTISVAAALGDEVRVQECLSTAGEAAEVDRAFLTACRFEHRAVAALILDCCIELEPALGERIERWWGLSSFIDYLIEHPQSFGNPWQTNSSPWQTVVMAELLKAIDEDNLLEFTQWLNWEPDLLGESQVAQQVELIEHAVLKDRGPFITRVLELDPALMRTAPLPRSSAFEFALDYGNDHLIPLLTEIWPMPDDLSHAAGIGDFERVKSWFDDAGRPKLKSLAQHYPTNSPATLRNQRWNPASVQHVLDVALAWSCVNHHFEIAEYLLQHGANVNTNWSTHEPASILHECAVHARYEAAEFLIDHGIDMTIRDYRWNATAEGWAIHAAQDKKMAELLANADSARKTQSS